MKKLCLSILVIFLALPTFAMFPPDYSKTPNTSNSNVKQSGFGNTNSSKKITLFPQEAVQVPNYRPEEMTKANNTQNIIQPQYNQPVQYQEQSNKIDDTVNKINIINNAIRPFIKGY